MPVVSSQISLLRNAYLYTTNGMVSSCEQRIAMQGERESRQQATKIKAFHLVVEGYRLLMYWMHLEVAVDTTLATLDRFLRETWLECCGHLSVFRIGGYNYYVDTEMDAFWDMRRKNMQVMLEEVCPIPGILDGERREERHSRK